MRHKHIACTMYGSVPPAITIGVHWRVQRKHGLRLNKIVHVYSIGDKVGSIVFASPAAAVVLVLIVIKKSRPLPQVQLCPFEHVVNVGDPDYDPLYPYGFGLTYGA